MRDLAEKMRARGLRVWFDDWEILPGGSIPSRLEAGLAGSAVMVLCMSEHSLGSDWAALESQTFRFRDPLNRDRRFIPLLLDDVTPGGSLAQFRYIDWRRRSREELDKLVLACQGAAPAATTAAGAEVDLTRSISLGHTSVAWGVACDAAGTRALSSFGDGTLRVWDLANGTTLSVLEGHTSAVLGVACDAAATRALSASDDGTVHVWDLASGVCERVLDGTSSVRGVACDRAGTLAVGACDDGTVLVWDLATGACKHLLEGHTGAVRTVACNAAGTRALSASDDGTVRLWDVGTGACKRVLEGHLGAVRGVACNGAGTLAVSASDDRTMRVWDLRLGICDRILEGHAASVRSVALSANATRAVSASDDRTVRVWDLGTGVCERVFEGHTSVVRSVAWSSRARRAVSASDDGTVRVWDVAAGACERVLGGHSSVVWAVACGARATRAVSASDDTTVRVWDLSTGACECVLEGHAGAVRSVACNPRATHALSGSEDGTLRVWDIARGACERVLRGHTRAVRGVAWNSRGRRAVSASDDGTLRVWDILRGACESVLSGHDGAVQGVACNATATRALSASDDGTVRVWDVAAGACERVLQGHAGPVQGVACDRAGIRGMSASGDGTVRVWDLATGACERVLEGHTGAVWAVACNAAGTRALSGSGDGTVRVWDLATGACERVLTGHGSAVRGVAYDGGGITALSVALNSVLRMWSTARSTPAEIRPGDAQVSYTNAKVVLVGESQAGKTGLATRLAHRRWELTESTLGAWATQVRVPAAASHPLGGGDREIWLWDFGGQADQRLIHQLYLGDAALAVLVFDGQREDILPRLWDWDRALAAAGGGYKKLLAAGRADMYPPRLSRGQIDEFCAAAGFAAYFETSAKSDIGCEELREAIVASIDWRRVPWHTSPATFQRLRREILKLKDSGRALTSSKELGDWLPTKIGAFEPAELDAVIGLLAGPGAVLPLGFGGYVLLRPEVINAYAQAVIGTLRDDPLERGCITEERALRGELNYPPGFERLGEADERIVLHAMHKQLIERAICLRDHDLGGRRPTVLVFPSYYRRERPDRPCQPQPFMTYRFGGYLDDVYATLVVRLHHSEPFRSAELWRNAADLRGSKGDRRCPNPDFPRRC